MPNVYPTGIETFLIADHVRTELAGKVTVIGAMGGAALLLPPNTVFPVGFPLAFFIVFEGGSGDFDTRISIKDPEDKPLVEAAAVGRLKQTEKQVLQLAINFGTFIVPSTGRYQVDVSLDDKIYTKSFTIGLATDFAILQTA